MSKRILLVTSSPASAELIDDAVQILAEESGLEIYLDLARHQREALTRLDGTSYDLVITEEKIPADGKSSIAETDQLGLQLVQRIKNDPQSQMPVIFIMFLYDAQLEDQLSSPPATDFLTRQDPQWEERLKHMIKRKLMDEKPQKRSVRLELDVILYPEGPHHYRMNLVGEPGFEDEGKLQLDTDELRFLAMLSQDAGKLDTWEAYLRNIGEKLFKQIFECNIGFHEQFLKYCAKVEDQQVEIRFIVERNWQPILLEAIKRSNENHYWMLKWPIYRRLKEFSNRSALYQDTDTREQPLNCIIIEADIESRIRIPRLGIELNHLENVVGEVSWLENTLKDMRQQDAHSVGEVVVIRKNDHPDSFKQAVRDALVKGHWHIVHFAGHTYFDAVSKIGRFFFPGNSMDNLDEVSATAEEFASWLSSSDSRFVYLSSCHSSEEDFVFELANGLVPAVMGFQWDIDDDLAELYTQRFYTHLFDKRSLEYAFLEARKEMHAQHRERPIWASPIMVIQSKRA